MRFAVRQRLWSRFHRMIVSVAAPQHPAVDGSAGAGEPASAMMAEQPVMTAIPFG